MSIFRQFLKFFLVFILIFSWVFSGQAPIFEVQEAQAAVTQGRPASDILAGWNTCMDDDQTSCGIGHYAVLDEVVSTSNNPPFPFDAIATSQDGDENEHDISNPTDVGGTSVDVRIHIYAATGSNSDVNYYLTHDGGITRHITVNIGPGPAAWFSSATTTLTCATYAANCQAFVDALEIEIFQDKSSTGAPTTATVQAAYVDLEYTVAGAGASTFEQSAYRWFANSDSVDVGAALAAANQAATAPAEGVAFRLRALIHITANSLSQNGETFRLQFAEKVGDCDTSFTGENYATVKTDSGRIRFFDNATPADGAILTANDNDPPHSTDTIIYQTYEEANDFTNASSTAIGVGEDGMWDFSLVNNSAPGGATYCFRIIKSDGTSLDTYTVIPEITMPARAVKIRLRGTIRLRLVRLF